jgi:hypothetical protein
MEPDLPAGLLKGHNPARSKQSAQSSDDRGWIWLKLKDQASNNGVKGLNIGKGRNVCPAEDSVFKPDSQRAFPRRIDGGLIEIDGDHSTLSAYQSRDEHRHIAHPTADVQDTHPRRNSRLAKKMIRCRRQHLRLSNQTALLAIRMAKKVLGLSQFHDCPLCAFLPTKAAASLRIID